MKLDGTFFSYVTLILSLVLMVLLVYVILGAIEFSLRQAGIMDKLGEVISGCMNLPSYLISKWGKK